MKWTQVFGLQVLYLTCLSVSLTVSALYFRSCLNFCCWDKASPVPWTRCLVNDDLDLLIHLPPLAECWELVHMCGVFIWLRFQYVASGGLRFTGILSLPPVLDCWCESHTLPFLTLLKSWTCTRIPFLSLTRCAHSHWTPVANKIWVIIAHSSEG